MTVENMNETKRIETKQMKWLFFDFAITQQY